MNDRLVVIALSEASPRLVDEFCARGVMPRLAALRARGKNGRTRYGAPCLLTPQMWATILTGRGAGDHGIFDYWQRGRDGRFREMRGSGIQGPALWNALGERGIASGFVNVPMTYPPPRSKGFAIAGQDAPGDHPSIAFPDDLHGQIVREFGRYHHKDIFPGRQGKEAYAGTVPTEVRRQADLFAWLARRPDWRFLMLFSHGTAFAQHYFWDDMTRRAGPAASVVERTFAASDELIGRVADVLRPTDTLFVMSECGAGPIASGVRLNTWLHQQGLLARRRRGASGAARVFNLVRTLAPRYLPRRAFHFANRLPLKSAIQASITLDGIDWPRTTAFHRGKGEGNIYINLAGREPHGVVPQARYDIVRDDIIARLGELRDPNTGERVARAVHRREDIFAGEQLAAAPDLCVEWLDFKYMPAEDLSSVDEIFGPRIREYMSWPTTGSHRPEGFFLATGPRIAAGELDAPIDLMDLAPTWLGMLGAGAPAGMQGRSAFARLRA